MIRANHITSFAGSRDQKRKILDNVSFTLRPGTVTVLLGPNGAGKSTLLKIVSGESRPGEGIILWNGRSIHSIPPAELALERAVLSQQYAIGLPFTVEEIVSMGRYPHQHYSDEATDRAIVRQCLEEMQVIHLAGRLFQSLSGGEQQRVQLARVLAQLRDHKNRKKLLLLDEPTSSMDWLHQQLCLEKARELARGGSTVVVVLHDLNLAAQFGDMLLLLKNGRLLAAGTPAELLEPALISEAYGIQASVLYPESCAFPVIVPVAGATFINEKNYADE